jgi:hypothetical protein
LEEDVDPDDEAGRRVRPRPAEPEATAGEPSGAAPAAAEPEATAGEPSGAALAAAEPQAKPREQIHISRQRWQYLHNHVLGCLKQAEAGEMEGKAAEIKVAAQKFIGLSQHDIIKWHIRTELEKCGLLLCCLSAGSCCPFVSFQRRNQFAACNATLQLWLKLLVLFQLCLRVVACTALLSLVLDMLIGGLTHHYNRISSSFVSSNCPWVLKALNGEEAVVAEIQLLLVIDVMVAR